MRLLRCLRGLMLLVISAMAPVATGAPPVGPEGMLFIGDLPVPYRTFAAYVMPGEPLELRVQTSKQVTTSRLIAATGELTAGEPGHWTWRYDAVGGPYLLTLELDGQAAGQLNVFVLQPAAGVKKGRLESYRIGSYPDRPLKGRESYRNPEGFVRVTEQNLDTPVSPNFRLREFISKQQSKFPKYLVLNERLLVKLERILTHIQGKGVTCDSFHVMSGYRTPFYNRAIGNVRYSRHQWGDAADIFVDCAPRDGNMDDLNGDGRTDFRDAAQLTRWVEEIAGTPALKPLTGGLAPYPATSAHGPFVHVDTRGYKARWSGKRVAHRHP